MKIEKYNGSVAKNIKAIISQKGLKQGRRDLREDEGYR